MRRRRVIEFVALAAILSGVAACTATTPAQPAAPVVEPAPPVVPAAPLPTLIGTWTRTHHWIDEDTGQPYREVRMLTFTPDRYVETVVEFTAGEIEGDWKDSGTWTEANGTVTRIWREWDDDLDRPRDQDTHMEKSYLWGNAERSLLLMTDWADSYAPVDSYVAYTRVQDPLPSLIGAWEIYDGERPSSINFDPDSGRTQGITFNQDGTFAYSFTNDDNGHHEARSGTWEQASENHILWLTVTNIDVTLNGETIPNIEEWREMMVGHRLSFRYAPTNDHSAVRISPWYIEHAWDSDTMTWGPHPRWTYGDYYRIMVRP